MGRSFENFDVVRTKQNLFNIPKHSIGKVMMVCKETVHVIFAGVGVVVCAPVDIELIPRVVADNLPQQLELFERDEMVRATLVEDKIIITPYLGTSNNVVPDDPEREVITTKRQLWLAYIKSTCFADFYDAAGFRKLGA